MMVHHLSDWTIGRKRKLNNSLRKFKIFMTWIITFVVIGSIFVFPDSLIYRPVVFSLYFSLVFLMYAPSVKSDDHLRWFDIVLIILSLTIGLYFLVEGPNIILRRPFISSLENHHRIIAIVTTVILNEGVRRVVGSWIVGINFVFISYAVLGHWIPGRFGVRGLSLDLFIDGLYMTRTGVWGVTVAVAFGTLILIIMFSSFVLSSGLDKVILKLFQIISFRGYGGSGMLAVIASAFFGMISGGGTSNVTTTGTLTIPLMKHRGYSPVMAAAIESSASMASTFTPPIMGSVAFLMAELLGLSYGRVMGMAIIPAVVFYITLLVFVKTYAQTHHIDRSDDTSNTPYDLIWTSALLFIPMIYFIASATLQRSITRSALEAIGITILIQSVMSLKLDIKGIIKTIEKAIDRTMPIVISMAGAGLFIGIINLTGFATKLSVFFRTINDWPIGIVIVIMALMILFLGLALNTISTYLIAVVLFAPTLTRLGFEPSSIHMFILIFSALGGITPPVALTSLTAATIAQASPDKVGWMSMVLSTPAYVIALLILFFPQILWPSFTVPQIILVINMITLIAGVVYLVVLGKPTSKILIIQMYIILMIGLLWVSLATWIGSLIAVISWIIIMTYHRKVFII